MSMQAYFWGSDTQLNCTDAFSRKEGGLKVSRSGSIMDKLQLTG